MTAITAEDAMTFVSDVCTVPTVRQSVKNVYIIATAAVISAKSADFANFAAVKKPNAATACVWKIRSMNIISVQTADSVSVSVMTVICAMHTTNIAVQPAAI